MGRFAAGAVVLVRFPFSDLSSVKLRPAVVLAYAGSVDWVLCQVTSNPYGDAAAVSLRSGSFASGGLPRDSVVRPGKLFTASDALVVRVAGVLTEAAHRSVADAVIALIRSARP